MYVYICIIIKGGETEVRVSSLTLRSAESALDSVKHN